MRSWYGNMRHETCDMRHETWDMRHETWNMRHETWDMRHGTLVILVHSRSFLLSFWHRMFDIELHLYLDIDLDLRPGLDLDNIIHELCQLNIISYIYPEHQYQIDTVCSLWKPSQKQCIKTPSFLFPHFSQWMFARYIRHLMNFLLSLCFEYHLTVWHYLHIVGQNRSSYLIIKCTQWPGVDYLLNELSKIFLDSKCLIWTQLFHRLKRKCFTQKPNSMIL